MVSCATCEIPNVVRLNRILNHKHYNLQRQSTLAAKHWRQALLWWLSKDWMRQMDCLANAMLNNMCLTIRTRTLPDLRINIATSWSLWRICNRRVRLWSWLYTYCMSSTCHAMANHFPCGFYTARNALHHCQHYTKMWFPTSSGSTVRTCKHTQSQATNDRHLHAIPSHAAQLSRTWEFRKNCITDVHPCQLCRRNRHAHRDE
jgi:hypothetical protein